VYLNVTCGFFFNAVIYCAYFDVFLRIYLPLPEFEGRFPVRPALGLPHAVPVI